MIYSFNPYKKKSIVCIGEKKKRQTQKTNFFLLIIFALIITASAFQFLWNLNSPFWGDEVFTEALACQKTWIETLRISAGDVHPPLYALITHFLFEINGCTLSSARLLGVYFLAISFVYYFKKSGIKNGAIFSLILFTSGSFWHYALEARPYSLIIGLSIMSVANWNTTPDANWLEGMLYSIAAATLHYIAILLPIINITYYLFIKKQKTSPRAKYTLFVLFTTLITYYVYSIFRAPPHLSNGFWIQPSDMFDALDNLEFLLGSRLNEFTVLVIITLGILKSKSNAHNFKNIIFGPASTVIIASLLIIASTIKPIFSDRYLLFMLPILAFSCEKAIEILSCSNWRGITKAGLVALILFSSFTYYCSSIVIENIRSYEWMNASEYTPCNSNTCGFVLDDPVLPAYTDWQYQELSSILFKTKTSNGLANKWIAIRPRELQFWLKKHPNKPFIYIHSRNPIVDINNLIAKKQIHCEIVLNSASHFCTTNPFVNIFRKQEDNNFFTAPPSSLKIIMHALLLSMTEKYK